MRDPGVIADLIISRFITNNGAKGKRNYFGCLGKTSEGVLVSRQNGSSYDVSKDYIIQAIEAVRKELSIYEDGPARLKPYINRWIYSPLWALLHLLSMDEIME